MCYYKRGVDVVRPRDGCVHQFSPCSLTLW